MKMEIKIAIELTQNEMQRARESHQFNVYIFYNIMHMIYDLWNVYSSYI